MGSKWFTAVVLSVLILSFSVTGYAQEIDSTILQKHYQILQAPVFSQLSGQAYLLGVGNVGQKGKPPLSVLRITGEVVGGFVAGTFLGLVGMLVGAGLSEEFCDEEFLCRLEFMVIDAIVGYALGSAVGVYLVGNIGDQTGSFLSALVGSVVALGGFWVAAQRDMHDITEFMAWAAPLIFATISFNLTRRYKSPLTESGTALINFRDGQMSFAVPGVYFRPDPLSVDLLRVRF